MIRGHSLQERPNMFVLAINRLPEETELTASSGQKYYLTQQYLSMRYTLGTLLLTLPQDCYTLKFVQLHFSAKQKPCPFQPGLTICWLHKTTHRIKFTQNRATSCKGSETKTEFKFCFHMLPPAIASLTNFRI